MLFRMLYDPRLAQAAYLIGCQRTGEAIIIDPERDVDRYVDAAKREGVRIVAVAETHIHADFLSGARELAERGARVYVSGEGGPDWTSRWLGKKSGGGAYDHRELRHGDTFGVGNIEFRALHTPGHTPEHMSYLVTDRGSGATEPMGILSGDFIFVGDLGRPDLLETAAGQTGAAEPSAHRLHRSVREIASLPDFLQVWPAHGAGSACGKALGAVPQSTLGYERRFSPAFREASDEAGFVRFILADQPEPPLYFARMKRENRDGPRVLGGLPRPARMDVGAMQSLDGRATAIVDTRPWAAFRTGHVPGSIFAPVDGMFAAIVGSWLSPEENVVLITEGGRIEEAVRECVRVGIDRIEGWFDPSDMEALERSGGRLVPLNEIDSAELRRRLADGAVEVLDVRGAGEWDAGHIAGARRGVHTRLPERLKDLPRDRRIVVHCRSGMRSARACSLLQREGFEVTNLEGGYLAWEQAGETVG